MTKEFEAWSIGDIPRDAVDDFCQNKRRDFLTVFQRGKADVFESMRSHFPKTYEALQGFSDFYAFGRRGFDGEWIFSLRIRWREVVLEIGVPRRTADPKNPKARSYQTERLYYLPESVFKAFYFDFDGMLWVDTGSFIPTGKRIELNYEMVGLPNPQDYWSGVEEIFGGFRGAYRKASKIYETNRALFGERPKDAPFDVTAYAFFLHETTVDGVFLNGLEKSERPYLLEGVNRANISMREIDTAEIDRLIARSIRERMSQTPNKPV